MHQGPGTLNPAWQPGPLRAASGQLAFACMHGCLHGPVMALVKRASQDGQDPNGQERLAGGVWGLGFRV